AEGGPLARPGPAPPTAREGLGDPPHPRRSKGDGWRLTPPGNAGSAGAPAGQMDEDPLGITFRLAGVAFLVAVNAFFVASEFALATVRRTRIEQLLAEGHRGADAVKRGLVHLDDSVAAAQL